MLVSVFGNMGYTKLISVSQRSVGYILTEKLNCAFFRANKACYGTYKLTLTVAVNACNTYNFALSYAESDVFNAWLVLVTA